MSLKKTGMNEMLNNYHQEAEARSLQGIPPLPLNPEQTHELTELLEKPVLLTPKEQGLASSLQIWYENGKDIVLGTGSKVSRWLDQSGNDRNASQTNILLQPTHFH